MSPTIAPSPIASGKSEVGYIAYIDESGDDGIRKVRPVAPVGATEWFVLSAFVIEKKHEPNVLPWTKGILTSMKAHQRRDLHFNKLSPERRRQACEGLAALPGRCFVVVSHKPTMHGYRNPRAELHAPLIGAKNYFYNWMTRLLLERVTAHCYSHSMRQHKRPLTVRLEFSSRGGMAYGYLIAYLDKLRLQSHTDSLYIPTGDIAWPVIDMTEIAAYHHGQRAGVQLADVVAGAFYQALGERDGPPGDCAYAKLLQPRLAMRDDVCWGYGLKFMYKYPTADLADHQREIFEFYGAPKKAAGPRPRVTSRF